MPRHVAFLRAINVGGHTVRMDRLRALFEELGFDDVETFIASGNVLFSTRRAAGAALARRIEHHLESALGYEVATFLRSVAEVAAIARHPAFPAPLTAAAGALNVGFLAAPLTGAALEQLRSFESDFDRFHVDGRELYWWCAGRQSESSFNNARFERRLGVRATFRGLATVRRLAARLSGSG